jgi:protein TonB
VKNLFLAAAIAVGLHAFLLTRGSNWLSREVHIPPVKRAVTLTLNYVKPVEKTVVAPRKMTPEPSIRRRTAPRPEPTPPPKPVIAHRPKRLVKKKKRMIPKPPPPLPEKRRHEKQRLESASGTVNTLKKEVSIRREPAHYEEPFRDEVVEDMLSDLPGPISERPESDPPEPETSSVAPAAVKIVRPLYRTNPRPPYPREARVRGYEGIVVLEVFVMKTGEVGDIGVFHSSGHRRLDMAAREAVKKWRFEPGTRNGIPVGMTVKIPIRFKLD